MLIPRKPLTARALRVLRARIDNTVSKAAPTACACGSDALVRFNRIEENFERTICTVCGASGLANDATEPAQVGV